MKRVEEDILLISYKTADVSRMLFSFLCQLYNRSFLKKVSSRNKWSKFLFEVYFEVSLHEISNSSL